MSASPRTAAATEATKEYAAQRAVDDPAKLERAARIVRAAIARGKLTSEDLSTAARSGSGTPGGGGAGVAA